MSTARVRLPNRRASEVIDYEHNGHKFTVMLSRFADGRPGELFLNSRGKSGSEAETNAKDGAIAASLALQAGIPLETLARAVMRDADGSPGGPLGAAIDRILDGVRR